ncbi:MAG: hypothetical protein AB8B96_04280 [Lysobacterales bacterium]
MSFAALDLSAWHSVTVGVTDFNLALKLWRDTFGFQQTDARVGPDADLARLWGIEAGDIRQQALLFTPGKNVGGLHLVEFDSSVQSVRKGAEVFDRCPKNLDIYVDDLPRRVEELKQRGLTFRNPQYTEVEAPDGTVFREIHLPSHDDINVVLLQVMGEQHDYTPQGFAGVGPLITIVGSAQAEKCFFADALGMQMLTENLLSGPEIEKMVGLPSGAQLDISIWGRPGQHFGQMELIEYRGVAGEDRYPRTEPPSAGVLHVNYHCNSSARLRNSLREAGAVVTQTDSVQTLPGNGEVTTVRSPGGLRMDFFSA